MAPIPITRAEYAAKFGGAPVADSGITQPSIGNSALDKPTPIPITRAEYAAKFGQGSALEAIVNSPKASDWTIGGSLKQGISGLAEGALNTAALIGDAAGIIFPNPYSRQKLAEGNQLPISSEIAAFNEEALPAKDPNYRYARTTGNFLGGNSILPGGNTYTSVLSAITGALGAQGAEDVTGDTKVAPVIGALAGGSIPSIFKNAWKGGKEVLLGATPKQIEGSAAQAFREQTGLTSKEIADAVKSLPDDDLAKLMTTPEVTGNAGAAQLEKTLGGRAGQFSNDYDAAIVARDKLRGDLINSMSETKAVNKEGLGSSLINQASNVQDDMLTEARTLWEDVPRNTKINIQPQQAGLESTLNFKQGGLGLNAKVEKLVSQILDPENMGVKTSGALQDIRSDALMLLRDNKSLSFADKRALQSIEQGVLAAMDTGLKGNEARIYNAAREATASERAVFGRSAAGGSLVNDAARPANVLSNAIRGDTKSITELKAAIRNEPALLEDVKRGFLDMIPTDASGKLTTNGIKKFTSQNEGAIKELLGESHHKNMTRILEDMRSQDSVASMAGRASAKGSATAQKLTVAGDIASSVANKIIPGTGKLGSLIRGLESMAGKDSAAKIDDLLFRAAMDPKYAAILADKPSVQKVNSVVDLLLGAITETGKNSARAGFEEIASRDQVSPEVQAERDKQKTAKSIFANRASASDSAAGKSPSQSQESQSSIPSQARQGTGRSGLLQLGQQPQSMPIQSEQVSQSSSNRSQSSAANQLPLDSAINLLKPTSYGETMKKGKKTFTQRLAESGVDPEGLDPLDLAQIKAESSGIATIEGPRTKYGNAKGLMQLLDSTGKEWHKKLKLEGEYDPFDPYQNITIGKAYREYLVNRYDGDVRLGLAAYNWGLGNLDKLIAKSKTGTFEEIVSKMPSETRNYVNKIMAQVNGGVVKA